MRTLRALAVLVTFCLFPWRSPAQSKPQTFTPQDMLNIVEFIPGSEPVLSPDGAWIAYGTKDPSLESNISSGLPAYHCCCSAITAESALRKARA